MEAAAAASGIRARRFERECERLRPLGEAYLLRRFAGRLGRADAEDVVAEVLIRLHREFRAGRAPRNLRAMFLTSARNAAIDLLRARSARPATVGLEAAAEAPAPRPAPDERAEEREDAVRLREALARMRGGYREAILLRFGLDLKIAEIAAHFEISEAAAKKRLLRAVAQVRKRMAAIEAEELCPQMRELARSGALEKQASGLASESEAEALRAHFAHCGSCRAFLVRLRGELYELGSSLAGALLAGRGVGGRLDALGPLGHWAASAADAAHGAAGRLRHLALRAAAPASGGDGAAGALMGTSQKIAAVCGAGAAATATCLLSGAVGPGIGAAPHPDHPVHRPASKVKRLSSATESPPPELAPGQSGEPAAGSESGAEAAPQPHSPPSESSRRSHPAPPSEAEVVPETSPEVSSREFGIKQGSSTSEAASASPPASTGADARPAAEAEPQAPSFGASEGGSGSRSSGGGSVGFQGD